DHADFRKLTGERAWAHRDARQSLRLDQYIVHFKFLAARSRGTGSRDARQPASAIPSPIQLPIVRFWNCAIGQPNLRLDVRSPACGAPRLAQSQPKPGVRCPIPGRQLRPDSRTPGPSVIEQSEMPAVDVDPLGARVAKQHRDPLTRTRIGRNTHSP